MDESAKGIAFPSDLPAGDRMLLAGRVVHRDPRAIWLADAFATVRIEGVADVEAGDLVVLAVRRRADRIELEALTERHRPLGPPGREQSRLIRAGVGPHLRTRARALAETRSFFSSRRFVEVDTPLLVRSPGLDLHVEAVAASGGFLITSPEYQMKRLLAGGIPRLFQLSHVFRRDEQGAQHNPEFTLLEWYRAFAEVDEVMNDTEQLIAALASAIRGRPEIETEAGPIPVAPPYQRISVAEAFERFAGTSGDEALALARDDPDSYFRLMVDRVEPALLREGRPIFLFDYPIAQASLARARPSDPRVCERFELYIGGVELCNGFGELTDATEQRRRLTRDQKTRADLGRDIYPIDEHFLQALEEGMPPSAGNALGFDRVLALCLGETDIARTLPFPAADL